MKPGTRMRRFLFGEIPGFPDPGPEKVGVRIFHAPRYWKSNVCGGAVAGIGAAGLFIVVGGILLWQSLGLEGRLWGAGLASFAILEVSALLAGNLAALSPYAVEVEEGKGFRFYSPFKQFYIPTQEVKRVRWSWLCAGWVIRLRRRRGLLSGFIIHRAWGQQGRELALAIEQQLTRNG